MASLTFNKEGGNWVAYFKAETDFALHIERDEAGVMSMEQSTTGGGYAVVEDFPARSRYGRAFDYEFSALVYPKFIRITSTSEPTFAAVTTDGEVTEIKSQSKEIEVTSNGTMDITPDAGFAYLNSVKVKTNVPSSGEGGGSASSVEYLDITNAPSESWVLLMRMCSLFVKQEVPLGEIRANSVLPTFQSQSMRGDLMGVSQLAIDFKALISIDVIEQKMTIAEFVMENGATQADLDSLPRITEAEFYNLNA